MCARALACQFFNCLALLNTLRQSINRTERRLQAPRSKAHGKHPHNEYPQSANTPSIQGAISILYCHFSQIFNARQTSILFCNFYKYMMLGLLPYFLSLLEIYNAMAISILSVTFTNLAEDLHIRPVLKCRNPVQLCLVIVCPTKREGKQRPKFLVCIPL